MSVRHPLRARGRVAVCVSMLLLCGVCSSGARARSFTALREAGTGGPVLVGSAVAWTRFGDRVVRADDGTGQRELARLPEIPDYLSPSLSASGDLLVVDGLVQVCEYGDCKYLPPTSYWSLFVGRAGTELECVGGRFPARTCGEPDQPLVCPRDFPPTDRPSSVRGWLVATQVRSSAGGDCATLVRDFAPEAPLPNRALIDLTNAQVNGRWVAGRAPRNDVGIASPADIVVTDWRTKAVALRVSAIDPTVLSVGADGTVIYLTYDGSRRLLMSASPTRPQPVLVTQTAPYGVQFLGAGTRVAVLRYRVNVRDEEKTSARFDVFDVTGRHVARENEPALAYPQIGSWDFDGQRLAFASKPCAIARIVVRELSDPTPARPYGRCPPVRVGARASPSGRFIRVRARCADHSGKGCRGRIRLLATIARRGRPRSVVLGISTTVTLSPSRARRVRVHLSSRARRLIRTHAPALTALSIGAIPERSKLRPIVRRTHVRLQRG